MGLRSISSPTNAVKVSVCIIKNIKIPAKLTRHFQC